MTGRTDEVKTSVNPQVSLLHPLWLLLLPHIRLVLVIDKVDDGRPRVTVVDIVTKAGGVDDGQLDFELFLLQLSLDDLHLCQLVELLQVTTCVVLGRRQLRGEQRVDECRFTQPRLAYANEPRTNRKLWNATYRRP